MIYQPRCFVVFDAQQKHNISQFFNFASELLKFFRFFIFNRTVSKSITSRGISALRYALIRRNGSIIYHRFETLQAEFSFFQQKKSAFCAKTRKKPDFSTFLQSSISTNRCQRHAHLRHNSPYRTVLFHAPLAGFSHPVLHFHHWKFSLPAIMPRHQDRLFVSTHH